MIIVKIGGGKDINTEGVIKDLSEMDEPFIIIHGANALRDNILKRLNQEKKVITSVSGYSSVYTDNEMINTIMMTYAGLKNKRIVEFCQQNGINAVGLTGIDGRLIQGKRNVGIRVREDGKLKIVRDISGKPSSINKELLELLLNNGYTPVISIPIMDEEGYAINSENDDIIRLLQQAFKAEKIIQLIEEPGLLLDKENKESMVKNVSKTELLDWEEKVEGRMKRKILAIRKLFENNVQEIIITDGRTNNPIKDALKGKGTIIK